MKVPGARSDLRLSWEVNSVVQIRVRFSDGCSCAGNWHSYIRDLRLQNSLKCGS